MNRCCRASRRPPPRGVANSERGDIEHDQAEVRRILELAGGDRLDGETLSDRVDAVVLHPLLGPLILAVILFLVFQAVFAWAQVPMDAIKSGVAAFGNWLGAALPPSLLRDLLVNGVLAGVGSVLVFLRRSSSCSSSSWCSRTRGTCPAPPSCSTG